MVRPAVTWDGDGLPRSTHYPDIYRSQGRSGDRGLVQARHVFLQGCELLGPTPLWRNQAHWCILENGFGLGLNFLATWQAWRADPQRPERLHHVATEAHPVQAQDLIRSSRPWPELAELTQELARDWWGLLPGLHRFSFDAGRVTLDLVIGDSEITLPQLTLQADSVYLDGFAPQVNPAMWSTPVLTQLVRLSRSGARWASWCVSGEVTRRIQALGLEVRKRPGLPPKRESLTALCRPQLSAPAITSISRTDPVWVLGAGLAGAQVARSLAERGQAVRLIDAVGPAAGASGLPAGLFAAHTSGDDNALSRLTRLGLRHTLARLANWVPNSDWAASGLDERMLGVKARRQPPSDAALAQGWYAVAPDLKDWREDWWQAQEQGWHQPRAGWLKPERLIHALIDHPLIETAWGWQIGQLQQQTSGWSLQGRDERQMTGGSSVVIALGPASRTLMSLCGRDLPMQAVRGQISFGPIPDPVPEDWPQRPRNGDGSVIPQASLNGQTCWLAGSSFDRSSDQPLLRLEDHRLNAQRWQHLAPESAPALPPIEHWQAWAGVRATVRDRLPWVGPASTPHSPGLWVLTGLGARGLTLSALCAEQLAARLTGTPHPLPEALARAIDTARLSDHKDAA